jgi:excisionase family DNA binding protein
MTNLVDLSKLCPDITINIKIGDLMEANKKLIEDVRSALEKQIREENEEKYLSPDEVCKLLNVSKPTLWRWEKIEYLIPIRVGKKVRYKLSEVENTIKLRNNNNF